MPCKRASPACSLTAQFTTKRVESVISFGPLLDFSVTNVTRPVSVVVVFGDRPCGGPFDGYCDKVSPYGGVGAVAFWEFGLQLFG